MKCNCQAIPDPGWKKKTPIWICPTCGRQWKRRVFNWGSAMTIAQKSAIRELIDSKFTPVEWDFHIDEQGQVIFQFFQKDKTVRTIRIGRKGGLTLVNCAEDRFVTGPDVLTAEVY